MTDENKSSYRSIFKATSLFGGVQVYQILIQIIKSKFVAVLLGPAGVGIMGLYQSGLQLIQQISSMGLAASAVRDVSEANGTNDIQKIAKTIRALQCKQEVILSYLKSIKGLFKEASLPEPASFSL